jgi:NitT/TauT family transport system substrate-binding protein
MQKILLVLVVALVLAACGGTAAPTTENTPTDEPGDARPITVAFAFIPNIQFAPFYVADSKGYYADAGLDVSFDYNFETDVVQRVAAWPASEVQFAHNSGLSVMLGRQQGLPITSVMTHYQQFPVVFFSKGDVELSEPEDLQGKSIGIPGRFGASYYAMLALLDAGNMQESELNVQEVGFNQFQLVLQDDIQVASGYAMNEPIKLREEGADVNVLRVADYFPLVSDGIITHEQLIETEPELVRDFVQATLRGLRDTLDDPDEAFELSLPYIPEADLSDTTFARAVLEASLPYWESENEPLGNADAEQWEQSHALLLEFGLLNEPVDVQEAYTNQFIPQE